jgi:hypothetical protein
MAPGGRNPEVNRPLFQVINPQGYTARPQIRSEGLYTSFPPWFKA